MIKKSLIYLITVIALMSSAFACSCIANQTIESKYEKADEIFSGQILLKEKIEEQYKILIQVNRVYKGDFQVQKTIFTHQQSATCGFNFEIKKDYLIYANKIENEKLSTGLCSGTKLLNQSKEDIEFLSQKKEGENIENLQNIIVEYDNKENVLQYHLEVMLPNPCYDLNTNVNLKNNISKENYAILNINSNPSEDNCIQVIDIREISGTINSDKNIDKILIKYNEKELYLKKLNNSEFTKFEKEEQNLFQKMILFVLSLFGIEDKQKIDVSDFDSCVKAGNPIMESYPPKCSDGEKTYTKIIINSSIPTQNTICTKEFKPVCAEVQVQCITVPCNPINQTFSNKCLAMTQNAKILYDGECEN